LDSDKQIILCTWIIDQQIITTTISPHPIYIHIYIQDGASNHHTHSTTCDQSP